MCTLLTAPCLVTRIARPLHVASAAGHQVRASRKCGMLPRQDAIVVVESASVKLGIKPEEFVIILIIVMTLLVMSFAIWKVSFSVKVPRLWPPTCSVAVRTFPPFPSGRPNITRFEYEEPLRVSGFRYGFQE